MTRQTENPKTVLPKRTIDLIKNFALHVLGACRDLVPIVLVIVIFQLLVLRRPFPQVFNVVVGLFMVVLGLALFVLGLEIGLFPIGETMAEAFAQQRASTQWGSTCRPGVCVRRRGPLL